MHHNFSKLWSQKTHCSNCLNEVGEFLLVCLCAVDELKLINVFLDCSYYSLIDKHDNGSDVDIVIWSFSHFFILFYGCHARVDQLLAVVCFEALSKTTTNFKNILRSNCVLPLSFFHFLHCFVKQLWFLQLNVHCFLRNNWYSYWKTSFECEHVACLTSILTRYRCGNRA